MVNDNGARAAVGVTMRQPLLVLTLVLVAIACRAADDTTSGPASAAAPAPTTTPQTPVPASVPTGGGPVPVTGWAPRVPRAVAKAAPTTTAPGGAEVVMHTDPTVKVSAEAKWQLAGYNNDEVVYTIYVTSHDPRIIRCVLDLSGFYYENGEKLTATDRQSMTVFPEQVLQIGNWQGLDQKSGATYTVKCHPL
jgi:hypothetical protein